MPGRIPRHIREPDGTLTCAYHSHAADRALQPPPVCAQCGRTTVMRVWSREGWERRAVMVARAAERKQRRQQEQAREQRVREKARRQMEAQKKAIDWSKRLRVIATHQRWTRPALGDFAEATGASARTVEAWWTGRHKPDRRSRRVLRVLWREAEAAEAEQEEARRVEAEG